MKNEGLRAARHMRRIKHYDVVLPGVRVISDGQPVYNIKPKGGFCNENQN